LRNTKQMTIERIRLRVSQGDVALHSDCPRRAKRPRAPCSSCTT
jgi:hypothetical protein